jgi:hypothetical protein
MVASKPIASIIRSTPNLPAKWGTFDALRGAFQGVSTLFLLNAVVPDEFTQALIALNVSLTVISLLMK